MRFEQYFEYEGGDDGQVRQARGLRLPELDDPKFGDFKTALEMLPAVVPSQVVLDQPVITIGRAEDLNDKQHAQLVEALRAFIPWKKGPFEIFGHMVDAEWRSDMKWARLEPYVSDLRGKVVADIGCNNGYFMFRMAAQQPREVIGFEPYAKHLFAFDLLQTYAAQPQLYFDLLGIEHIDLFPDKFDTIFCLGILYHHTDPVGLLRKMRQALKPGGEIFVECQGILDDLSYSLVPEGRYAQARGFWNLPTPACLKAWIKRTGFREVEIFSSQLLSTEEQRTTPWAPVKSLADFLDPNDPALTVEGYPAPARIYAKAIR